MAKSRIQRAIPIAPGRWGCPACERPIHPPLIAAALIKDGSPPHYWQIHYECSCGTRFAIAVTLDLDHIDPERTASMPIRAGATPIDAPATVAEDSPVAETETDSDSAESSLTQTTLW